MLQTVTLQNFAKFQKFQLDNLVDFSGTIVVLFTSFPTYLESVFPGKVRKTFGQGLDEDPSETCALLRGRGTIFLSAVRLARRTRNDRYVSILPARK